MKRETMKILIDVAIFLIIFIILGIIIFLTLKNMNTQEEFDKHCSRISMNEYEDNCFCPCDESNWIERRLRLRSLCDGWIVNKNESCIAGITNVDGIIIVVVALVWLFSYINWLVVDLPTMPDIIGLKQYFIAYFITLTGLGFILQRNYS